MTIPTYSKSIARVFLLSVVMLFWASGAEAQQNSEQPATRPSEDSAHSVSTKNDIADQLEQLKTRLEQLQAIVDQQQRALVDMKARLNESDARSRAVASNNSSQADIVTASLNSPPPPSVEGSSAGPPKQGQPAKAKESGAPILAGWDDNHAYLKSADGSFVTNITGYAQFDFRGYQSGNHPPNTFLVRRARLALEGKIHRYYDFKIEGDFADTTSTLLRDFYVRVHRIEPVQIAAGQFKEPFSQEELRSDIVQDFVERSLVNFLAPSRSPGVMVSGVVRKGEFEYQLGLFNGKGLLAANTVGTPEGVGRVRFAPWRNTKGFWTKGLAFGGAFALGRNSFNSASVRGQTESRSFTFFTPDTVNGPSTRANGELTWVVGPAAVRVEYDQMNQSRNALGPLGSDLPDVVAKGYMGQFTYLLTGEQKSDVGVVAPKRSLFGDGKGEAGFGAWELKFRYSNLHIDDRTAKSNRAETIYFGANWYLNRFVKYVFDVGIERYKDPLRTPRPGDNTFAVVLSRIQLAF